MEAREWAVISIARQERQYYKREELRSKTLIPRLFPFYRGHRKGLISISYDLIRLVACCFVLILSACSRLPEIFPINLDQAVSALEETPRATALVSPSPTVEVKLAAFSTEPVGTPEQLVGTLTPTPFHTAPTVTPPVVFTSDLLFLADDKLMRWDHVTNFTTPLVEGVTEFSPSQDSRRIALLRDTNITANGVALYNLDLLDMENKQVTSLIKGIPRINKLTFSPNGLWIAYQEQQETNLAIYALNIRQPGQLQQRGICRQPVGDFCDEIGWSPDSFTLLWEDTQGIWISKQDKSEAELLTGHTIEVTDPKGEISQVAVTFNDVNWSPGGRYVLTQVVTDAGVCWFAVLDSYQGQWTEVPGTFDSFCPTRACVSWTDEGKLLSANISERNSLANLIVNQWQVVPTRAGLLALESEMEFRNLQIALSRSNSGVETKLITLWPGKIQDQFIGLGVGSTDPDDGMAIYRIDVDQEQIELIIQRPSQAELALWAPDGSGVLLREAPGKVIFVPFQGDDLVDLSESNPSLGESFNWTPAMARS